MHKPNSLHKNAFTLIEVVISVMIISIVIMALLTMYANNTHLLNALKKEAKGSSNISFLLFNSDYGFENKEKHLYDLVYDFRVDDDLRRTLKDIKVNVIYQELETIDMREANESSGVVFELGKTILKTSESANALFRLRLQ